MRRVAIIDESDLLSAAELATAVAALQVQLDRDLASHWGVRAVLSTAAPKVQLPADLWLLRVVPPKTLPGGAAGIHLGEAGTPYALVPAGEGWAVAASHELLEMLVDPYGHRFVAAPSPDPAAGGRLVYVLVEVADPCGGLEYTVRGVSVSNFVLPSFYSPAEPGPFDLLGHLKLPLTACQGGYLAWFDAQDGAWHRQLPDGSFETVQAAVPVPAVEPRSHKDAAVLATTWPGSVSRGGGDTSVGDSELSLPTGARKDALDVVKRKERDAAGPPTTSPEHRRAAPEGTGRAFVRPDERPDVGIITPPAPPAGPPAAFAAAPSTHSELRQEKRT